MIFFCSKRQLNFWKNNPPDQIFIDGYHKVPKGFSQLITIMGSAFTDRNRKERITYPIVHVLMNSKSSEAYVKMFLEIECIIKDVFEDRFMVFEAPIVTTDFELGLINASKWFFPKSSHLGCFVHFIRCQITNLKKMGFYSATSKKLSYKLLTLISVLPFILTEHVPVLFDKIKALQEFQAYSEYFKYFYSTWINGNYKVELWNVISKIQAHPELSSTIKHSNNIIESFHSLLNFVLLKSAQPTANDFVEALKYIECRTMNDLLHHDNKPLILVISLLQ